MDNRIVSIVVMVLGALLLLASLTADYAGIGDGRGFGSQQIMGAVAGIVILAFGFYRYRKNDASITSEVGKPPEGGTT
jgi:hypothetical protein